MTKNNVARYTSTWTANSLLEKSNSKASFNTAKGMNHENLIFNYESRNGKELLLFNGSINPINISDQESMTSHGYRSQAEMFTNMQSAYSSSKNISKNTIRFTQNSISPKDALKERVLNTMYIELKNNEKHENPEVIERLIGSHHK